MRIKTVLFIFIFFIFPQLLHAVPPFPGVAVPKGQTCFVNEEAAQKRAAALKKYVPGYASAISSTTYSLAVIRVDFSDQVMSKTTAETKTFFESMRSFYSENSYSLLTVTATITGGGAGGNGAFRMAKTHSYYAKGLSSYYKELITDAISTATAAGYNFSGYDYLMLYHAGSGAETATTSSSYIWSAFAPKSLLSGPTASGKTFSGATFVPETEFQSVDPLGVICHEFGHQLGLPDLYNTSTFGTQVGNWSLMDSGIYIGSPLGSNPAHFDAWSKLYLGFSSPETISYSLGSARTLSPAETTRGSFFRLPISVSDVGSDSEYFLLEYRKTSGSSFDNYIPAQGLLIWHVDDNIASNSTRLSDNDVNNTSSRRGVSLVYADSSDPSSNNGDSGDPWPGSASNTHFKTTKSDAYNGSQSGIQITNISGAGNSSMNLTIYTSYNNPAVSSHKEPGDIVVSVGDSLGGNSRGFANPAKGETTIIAVTPTASGKVSMKVYTQKGDLVWDSSFDATANQQSLGVWNGKNQDGSVVASGIYYLHISGGGLDVTKKIAVAR